MHRRPSSLEVAMPSSATRVAAILVPLLLAAFADRAIADTEIGTATSITTNVTGNSAPAGAIMLQTGDVIFQNEIIVTDDKGIGQFEFRDKTKLAIGPGSTVVLDNFVYDSDTSKTKVVINLTQGAMRFITGKSDHSAYEIVTPTATIGVRGTAFDVYTKPDGEIAVAMIDGAVEVCPRLGVCRVHNVIGKFLHMTPAGLFSLRDKWDGTFLAGVPFKLALPFLSDQKSLIPALRGKATTIRRYAAIVTNPVEKIIKLPVTKLPKLKLPKLFR
jgi:hypothetical protein